MSIFAVQYFDSVPNVASIPVCDVRARLRAAFDCLPISMVMLGWNLPDALVDGCAEECARAGAKLYRWLSVLTGDGIFVPPADWRMVGLTSQPIPGFENIPEFTFICPNHPEARVAVQTRIQHLAHDGRYQGMFLDRIRYPSPMADPVHLLGCFCDACKRTAASENFDLEAAQRPIVDYLAAGENLKPFVRALIGWLPETERSAVPEALQGVLDFRTRSISRFIRETTALIHETGLSVGLDCFSPSLTRPVGQSLSALDACCDWIKIMSYGHAFGPATLPFELLGLADWLVGRGVREHDILSWFSESTGLPLPPNRAVLRESGLSPEALGAEVKRGRDAGITTLLAGIELVELEGIVSLNAAQIAADLDAFRLTGADGLVLSWDLWRIPLDRLALVRQRWS